MYLKSQNEMARISSSEVSFVFHIWQSYFDASIFAAIWQILTYIGRVEAQTPGMQWAEEMQLNAQEIDLSKAHLDGVVAEDWLPDAD